MRLIRDLGLSWHDARRGAYIIIGTVAVAAALSLLLPTWYRSSASFTVDAGSSSALGAAGVLGLASQLGISGPAGAGTASPQYYADVLSSHTVTDVVALGAIPHAPDSDVRNDFGFPPGSDSPRKRDASRQRFADHFGASVNARTATITFYVEARTPYAAKAAADTLIATLNAVVIGLRRKRASAERAFIERRLDSASARQRSLEDTLRAFYASNRITVSSPNLQFAEVRLRRRVDFALELANQLRTQLEQARLQEVRDTPAILPITTPELPGRKSKPNRKLIAIVALFLGGLLALGDLLARHSASRRWLGGQA